MIFTQFRSVVCREYTLPREDHHNQEDGFRKIRELDLCWKSRPVVCTVKKWNSDWNLVSESRQFSFLGQNIFSCGTNKCSNHNNTEVLADLPEEQASQSSVRVVAARSKAKAKPQKRETVQLQSTVPMNERKWIHIEPAESFLSLGRRSRRKVVNLLRHCQMIQGAVQLWRIKCYFRNQFPQNQYWSDDRWKAAGGGPKRRYQYCSDISGTIVNLRALQGHSGRSLSDPSLQDNVIIQRGLFHHIYHIGCAF